MQLKGKFVYFYWLVFSMVTGETKSNFLLTKKFSFLFIISFLVVIVIIYVFSSSWEQKTKIKRIQIEGIAHSDLEAVESLIWEKLSGNTSLFNLKQILERLPFVQSCNIFHIDSETLGVQLTERFPIAKIERENNNDVFVDERGMFYTYMTKKNIAVPVILDPKIIEGNNLGSNNLISFLLKLKNTGISRFIGEIRESDDCFQIFTKSSRTKLIFANPTRDDEITKASNFLNKLETNYLMNSNEIDFRIDGQVIVR